MSNNFVIPPRKIVLDYDKVGSPEVLTVDGEPFPFIVALEHEPERVVLDPRDGFGYLTVGLIADEVVIKGDPESGL